MLLDISLPDRTGWDVLRELRERGLVVPTIIVSAVRVGPSRLAEFRPLAYLPKPFPLEALLRLVGHEPAAEGGERLEDLARERVTGYWAWSREPWRMLKWLILAF